jgi:hypothetical protein
VARTPWAAIVTFLIFVLGGLAWLFRRVWVRVRKEIKMLREVYAFAFGTEELDMSLADDSVEERLQRGSRRFEVIVENQERLAETQEEILLHLDVDEDPPEILDADDVDNGRWRSDD